MLLGTDIRHGFERELFRSSALSTNSIALNHGSNLHFLDTEHHLPVMGRQTIQMTFLTALAEDISYHEPIELASTACHR